jgi:threonine dehydrogenase-like Zn-dependent dehydrogenase
VGEVLELGPDAMTSAKPGDLVVSMPVIPTTHPPAPGSMEGLGYSNRYVGGYSEMMVLGGPLLLAVPNGLDIDRAALTEPMAVGLHAVNKSGITAADAAVVHGCGPVGLAVIASLRRMGVGCIVASDFSPARRALAERMGATVIVNPADRHPIDVGTEVAGDRTIVQFEAVGVPGILDDLMKRSPRDGRIVIVGVCMEPDRIHPIFGIGKELALQFVLGYTPQEFAASLQAIAEGEYDVDPLITGRVDLDGVAGAFDALANPEVHAKIIVKPV